MNRSEIEMKLNDGRVRLLEKIASLNERDLVRDATASEHDPAASWSAKDHLAHLAGIERNFNAMIARHRAGDANPVGLREGADGKPRTMPEIMANVHDMNERWIEQHREKPLSAIIALGQQVRGETLALLADLSDEELAQKLPGAPWGDGTIGGVISVAGDHARMHWKWLSEGLGG